MKFNRIIAMLLTVSNFIPVMSYSAGTSEDIVYNGMTFQHQKGYPDELILTEYTGNDENIVVPENIGGYTVTAIDNYVFRDNQNIKNVTLPDTINYFGSSVFRNSSLVSVNIPKSLNVIPGYSFNNCSELETVIFHDDILIINITAFRKTNIEIPPELHDTVTNQCSDASDDHIFFIDDDWGYNLINNHGDKNITLSYYLGNDTEITVPTSINDIVVTRISSGLSDTVKSIYIPENIELNTKFRSPALEEITLPYIERLSNSNFKNCKKLRKINFQGNPETFVIGDSAFENCIDLDYVPYPESCKNVTILKSAFENTGISELKIDIDSEINESAFRNCKKLLSIELNNAVVNARAFTDCRRLEDVTINGNSTLEESGFSNCRSLKNINVGNPDIPMKNAFYNCPELTQINNQDAFDSTTGDFNEDLKEFIFNNFNGSDDIGFINQYVTAQAEKIVSEIISDNMNDMQKIKAVHDWICDNTVYDDGLSDNKKNHTDSSVLMNDSTVCEGYARIANILYNTAGIESYYINGIGHAWNIVKAGNNYFHVDTTWDDGNKISYDWFMKSDEELRKAGGDHAKWETYIPSSLHSFQEGKNLPECTYSMGDVNQDNEISIADMLTLNKYILGENNIDYDSFVLADLTFDGVADAFDLVRMRQKIIRQGGNNT
ncbi:MAG: leucine-rich repeat protein [Ruminococcus sp.]|nr:leucine-rich repeat protein [Ruminococcus sp.]